MVATLQIEYPFTVEDLAGLPDDGRRYEVVGGELIVSPAPSEGHQRISSRLVHRLQGFVERTDAGVVYAAPFDVHLGEHDIVQPDILVVLKENKFHIGKLRATGPPDLVIEIVSSSSSRMDYVRKAATYATFGVPEYWIVDPKSESILAQSLNEGRFRPIESRDGLIRSIQIAGLVIDPAEIFATPSWMTFDGGE